MSEWVSGFTRVGTGLWVYPCRNRSLGLPVSEWVSGFSRVGMGLWALAVSARFYRSVRTAWCYASDVELCCNGAVSKVIPTLKRALVDYNPKGHHLATEHVLRSTISPQNTSPGVPFRHRIYPREYYFATRTFEGVPSRHRTHHTGDALRTVNTARPPSGIS